MAAVLGCTAARADDAPRVQLQSVEKALDESRHQQQALSQQATALTAQLTQLRQQEVAAAQSAQAHEMALTRLDRQLATLMREQKIKTKELARRRNEQAQLLTALLRLARDPPSGLAFAEGKPIDLLRGGILMSAALPPLVERSNLLGIELRTLADLRSQIEEAEARHHVENVALSQEEGRIQNLIATKAALQQQLLQSASASARRTAALAAQAHDLKDLIERADALERQREAEVAKERAARQALRTRSSSRNGPEVAAAGSSPALLGPLRPPVTRPFSQAHGRMVYPAAGTVVVSFGATQTTGATSRGITIETRPGAQVVAPYDGRVEFAGPFKGYGQILIIGHGAGYHSVLAGLGRIESSVGQWLVAGEPVGTMPAGEAKPRLYLELRQGGQPINPLPWLATRDAKVKG